MQDYISKGAIIKVMIIAIIGTVIEIMPLYNPYKKIKNKIIIINISKELNIILFYCFFLITLL